MPSTAQPISIDGIDYPSKTAAIVALHGMGIYSHAEIANKAQCAVGSIGTILSQQRKKLSKAGVWTAEKRDKVRRLFGKTMIYMAEAVDVPPAELLRYVLHGVIPPSQKTDTVEDIRWRQDQLALPVPIEPDAPESQMLPREAFEAPDTDPGDVIDGDGLIEQGPLTPPAADLSPEGRGEEVAPIPPARFPAPPPADPRPVAKPVSGSGVATPDQVLCLVDEMGRYLHESLDGMTTNPRFAWKGGQDKLNKIVKQLPHLKQLDQVAFGR